MRGDGAIHSNTSGIGAQGLQLYLTSSPGLNLIPPPLSLPDHHLSHYYHFSRHNWNARRTIPPLPAQTTSVHALARELLGKAYSTGVLELNASDARGIDVVRTKIKGFAQNKVSLPPGRHKIIILDEADSMTSSAQQEIGRAHV